VVQRLSLQRLIRCSSIWVGAVVQIEFHYPHSGYFSLLFAHLHPLNSSLPPSNSKVNCWQLNYCLIVSSENRHQNVLTQMHKCISYVHDGKAHCVCIVNAILWLCQCFNLCIPDVNPGSLLLVFNYTIWCSCFILVFCDSLHQVTYWEFKWTCVLVICQP